VAKRSPILGYNHNVRYRGLVFHVQTEDSGLLSPHLFTHLFHGGVIISTRKLVYDSGAAEDAIKSLMQAQHKAVLKDLKKGSFDDKIDQYLAGTPGLLPRGAEEEVARESEPAIPKPPVVAGAAPVEPANSRQATEADISAYDAPKSGARTKTAERGSAPTAVRNNLPPLPDAEELNVPTLNDGEAASVASAVAGATVRNRMPSEEDDNATVPVTMPSELSPLEIELELDEPDDEPQRARPRDTDVADVPARPGESVPPLPPPPSGAVAAPHPRASSSVGAATLKAPVTRPPSRPAITPPQVVSRPLTSRDSDAIEVYAPPPPSVDPPPGERPGQYSQHKKVSGKIPALDRPPTGPSVPPGLGRPGRPSSASPSGPIPKPSLDTKPTTVPPRPATSPVPTAARDQSSGQRARTPTPQRAPQTQTQPIQARTASTSGGVVMTRPAVIVGAPARPSQPQRVRKAREDEGRGFGQGLISEKSLDEVILAYLSEDADEK
jgi:hypothetical protein